MFVELGCLGAWTWTINVKNGLVSGEVRNSDFCQQFGSQNSNVRRLLEKVATRVRVGIVKKGSFLAEKVM
jgi:hypothetical protein